MSQLSEYLELIKNEKDTKLLPKNINSGVTILGVPGNSDFKVKVDVTKQSSTNALMNYVVEIRNLDLSYFSRTDLSSFFAGLQNLEKISFIRENNITNMYNMFSGCYTLEEIDFSNVNTSNVTNMSNMFFNCTNLVTISHLNTSQVTDMSSMFYGCENLITASQLNTNNVTNMWNMFYGCKSLTSIPQLNTSKVTSMTNMFKSCTSLSNESLNNILAMCANATSYTQTKTLNYIGLTSAQATTCQGLSNYQAFLDAGWTIGY